MEANPCACPKKTKHANSFSQSATTVPTTSKKLGEGGGLCTNPPFGAGYPGANWQYCAQEENCNWSSCAALPVTKNQFDWDNFWLDMDES
jgi:hypothetical protein